MNAEPDPTVTSASSPGEDSALSAGTSAGRVVVCVVAGIFAASAAVALVAMPDGLSGSRDEGAPAQPLWAVLAPNVAAIAVAIALPAGPPRKPTLPARPIDPRRLRASAGALLAIAVAFPLLTSAPGVADSLGYIALKVGLLVVAAAIVVASLRPAVAIERPAQAWRWWMPLAAIAAWFALSFLMPWSPHHDFSGVDPVTLAVVALITALTAGVGEELFYRRWLQTRLEAWLRGGLGAWPGIAAASLAFGLMHLGSHGTGDPLRDLASVVVNQGTAGLMLGVLWWRFRALWAIIATHILMNGWPVVAFLAFG